jgi:hypothetical protein
MSGVGFNSSCKNLFKKIHVLAVPCKYIYIFLVDNQKNFQTNLSVHELDTRKKNQLYLPISSLFCLQKGVSYFATKIFISLPNNIKNLWNDRVHCNIVLCKYLTLINLVLTELFEHHTINTYNLKL